MGPIDVQPGLDGAIQPLEYLKIFELLVTMQIRFMKQNDDKYKSQRLAVLKSRDQKQYHLIALKQIQEGEMMKKKLTSTVLSLLII